MGQYSLTAFDAKGKKLLEESFTAENESSAKGLGEKMLKENHLNENTHRLTTSSGKLLLFHS
jgi:hypothetical protein